MQNRINLGSIAAAGAILFAVVPAQAETSQPSVATGFEDIMTTRISVASLDLSSAAGRERLDTRVRSAVKRVCPIAAPMPVASLVLAKQCQRAAHVSATAQIERMIAARG